MIYLNEKFSLAVYAACVLFLAFFQQFVLLSIFCLIPVLVTLFNFYFNFKQDEKILNQIKELKNQVKDLEKQQKNLEIKAQDMSLMVGFRK